MAIARLINEISVRMRLAKAIQEAKDGNEALSERETLILELLEEKEQTNITDVGRFFPGVAASTISNDIMTLWRKRKLIEKTLDPDDPRSRQLQLTVKGRQELSRIHQQKDHRVAMLLKAISADEAEAEVLEKIVSRAVDFMDKRLALGGSSPPHQ